MSRYVVRLVHRYAVLIEADSPEAAERRAVAVAKAGRPDAVITAEGAVRATGAGGTSEVSP